MHTVKYTDISDLWDCSTVVFFSICHRSGTRASTQGASYTLET